MPTYQIKVRHEGERRTYRLTPLGSTTIRRVYAATYHRLEGARQIAEIIREQGRGWRAWAVNSVTGKAA